MIFIIVFCFLKRRILDQSILLKNDSFIGDMIGLVAKFIHPHKEMLKRLLLFKPSIAWLICWDDLGLIKIWKIY